MDRQNSDTPFEKFKKVAKDLLAVPKKELDKKAAEFKKRRAKRRKPA